MSTITVTNNTMLPIHVATSWDRIIQEFRNNVQPGEKVELPSANFGWQDFLAITGTPESEISHSLDWTAALGLGTIVLGTIGAIAGIAVAPFTGGTTAVLGVGAAVAVIGGATTVTGIAVTIGDFVINPATIEGLWGPDGYEMNVSGGKIFVESTIKEIKITKVDPIKVDWKNKVSKTSGTASSTKR